jgi:amidase
MMNLLGCLDTPTAGEYRLNGEEVSGLADEALARGEVWGCLHGVPFTLKDTLATAGMRTTAGFPPLSENVPAQDSTVCARLKAAGGILLGKTNVPPMAMSLQTDNPVFGRTNNPWNPERTVGGSSGGAAASVAAGLVPFDIGSDMSGSIRIPAHYCGVFGLKPTSNRLPVTGHIPPPPGAARTDRQMIAVGPIARCVEDLGLLAGVLAGPDGKDTEVAPLAWQSMTTIEASQLRIAWLPAFPGVPTSLAVRGAVERTVSALQSAGARVEQRDPGCPIDDIKAVWNDYFPMVARNLLDLAGTQLPVKPPATPPPTLAQWTLVLEQRDRPSRGRDPRGAGIGRAAGGYPAGWPALGGRTSAGRGARRGRGNRWISRAARVQLSPAPIEPAQMEQKSSFRPPAGQRSGDRLV